MPGGQGTVKREPFDLSASRPYNELALASQPAASRLKILRPALLAALGLLVYSGFHDYHFDDPFITYRVAENLARGLGWVYNPGERINAVTSPLWTLLLAGVHLGPHLPLPAFGPGLSILLLVIAAELLARALQPHLSERGAALAALFVVLNPHFAMTAGMETMLVFTLVLAAILAYQRKQWTLTALFLSLAILARMDAAISAALLAGHFLLRRKRLFPWPAILAFVLPLALWFGFSLFYFGELLPATLAVKSAQRQSAGHWGTGLIFLHHLGQILYKEFFSWDPLNLLLLALLGLGVAELFRRRSFAGLVLLAWALGHGLAYGLLLNVPAYDWYFAPLFLFLVLALAAGTITLAALPVRVLRFGFFLALILLGVWSLAWFGFRHQPTDQLLTPVHLSHFFFYPALLALGPLSFPRWAHRRFFQTLALILVAAAAVVPRNWNGWLQAETFPPTQFRNYRLAAQWIHTNLPDAKSIGANEIGVLGYYLPDRRIVDQCGIPTPGAAEHLARGDYTWWMLRYRPDAVVLHPARDWWWRLEDPVKQAPWFERAYRRRATLEADNTGPAWGKHAVEIWEKIADAELPRVSNSEKFKYNKNHAKE